ncbi:MAG TPA: YajD family HNH nuclease [Burkholderiaceae bacterium]|nr:YajD family HNH nuclease [Burkholderiaceae bacterium]
MSASDERRLDRIVEQTVRARQQREQGYRERALKLLPWICGRCGREFDRRNLHQLTVHHRDHDHDNNPPDGSNWELLCIYCHENEHSRAPENVEAAVRGNDVAPATHKPFADLQQRLKKGSAPEES